ncbi:MAG: DUF4382 domain-containing protein [Bacteroides sp.]|nr:DUF4382 domain-containing protein [Bacteroides sp.]
MKRSFSYFAMAILLATLFIGCSESEPEGGEANVQFRLTDMPGEYQQVNIDVLSVEVKLNDSAVSLSTNQGVYNLLEFVNGKDTLLVDDQLPSGYISQVRLILGDNNTVMIDNVVYDLKTPSAQQSGLKLNVHEEIISGESYAYVIDFVVEKSIVETGNGKYLLKPVIKVYTEILTGSIRGVVQPAESMSLVMAIMDDDTVSTYADTESGEFLVRGLYEGSHEVVFSPMDGYQDVSISDILVNTGMTTHMDTVFIQQEDQP